MTSSPERDPLVDIVDSALHIVRELEVRRIDSEQIVALTPSERLVLSHIDRHSGISLQVLADQLSLQTSNASAAIRRLVKVGLVVREQNPEDARRAALSLTPEARANVELIHEDWRQKLSGAPLDEADIATAARVMRALDDWLAES